MAYAFAEIAFTPAVRAAQDRNGSGSYAKFLTDERSGGDTLGPEEATFVHARDGFYQATVSETGWPYVQFRGGTPGFLRVLDAKTLAYADVRGNRQYLSLGNLSGNDRVSLILMDYPNARRLKIWGRAQTIEQASPDWPAQLPDPAPPGTERLMKITVDAFDWNCPRHIPRRLTDAEAGGEIAALQEENQRLRAALVARQA